MLEGSWLLRSVVLVGGLLLCQARGMEPPAPGPISGSALKAALILRLLDFVDWPDAALPRGDPILVCVVGDDRLASALRDAAAAVRGRTTRRQVRQQTGLKGAEACHLLVVGAYDERKVRQFLASRRHDPMLTVGEHDEFLSSGGMVRLRLEGGRVLIDLNLRAAAAARLQISSRLARLARVVDVPEGGGR